MVVSAQHLAASLRDVGRRAGLDAVGFATAEPFASTRETLESRRAAGLSGGMQFTYRNPARSTDPGRILPGAASMVVGARGYLRDLRPAGGEEHSLARVARYAWVDHYRPLRLALGAIASHLRAEGYQSRVVADDNALVDRAAAVRAGLGWYGKNTNVLLPGSGSWFVLGSVVTDAALPPDPPVAEGCGSCRRCLPACPTGAIVAPGVLDARRCLAWLLQAPGDFPVEYREALGDRLYGCDDCQEACPPNRVAARRGPITAAEPDAELVVSVLELLSATDDELLGRWGRWYIPAREPRYLRRNALVVLGNIGDGRNPDVVDALQRWLSDDDPLLRRHAVWAARRLGRADLANTTAGPACGRAGDVSGVPGWAPSGGGRALGPPSPP